MECDSSYERTCKDETSDFPHDASITEIVFATVQTAFTKS